MLKIEHTPYTHEQNGVAQSWARLSVSVGVSRCVQGWGFPTALLPYAIHVPHLFEVKDFVSILQTCENPNGGRPI